MRINPHNDCEILMGILERSDYCKVARSQRILQGLLGTLLSDSLG